MRGKPVDYAHVQELALKAIDLGIAASVFISEHYGITERHACMWLLRARKNGYDIPALTRHPKHHKRNKSKVRYVQQVCLSCTTCDEHFAVEEIQHMISHIKSVHKRLPTPQERTPNQVLVPITDAKD